MLMAPRASVSPHCRANRSGHETAVTYLPIRLAMGRFQRLPGIGPVVRHVVMALLLLHLLFLGDVSITIVAAGGTSSPGVTAVGGDARADKPAVQDGIALTGGTGAKSQSATASGGAVSAEEREKENLELLRTLMVEADVTESEKLSDTQYFLGPMVKKIKRHFLIDFCAMVLLFVGYYVLAAGLERRATSRTPHKSKRLSLPNSSQ